MRTFKLVRLSALLLMLSVFFATSISAETLTVMPSDEFSLTCSDFMTQEADEGIFLTSVPGKQIAKIYYRNRVLQAGDAIPTSALNELTLKTDCVMEHHTRLNFRTLNNGQVSEEKSIQFTIIPKKNDPPKAKDMTFETYKNIPNKGVLTATDQDKDMLVFELLQEPKRGTVELHSDGTFLYTPDQNKVGNDFFTFRAKDTTGHYSEPAKVTIKILKPTDKQVYSDMANDPDAFEAMWLKNQQIFTGSTVGDNLCFSPEKPVSRGDFLVMTMNLIQAEKADTTLTSGFSDEMQTEAWLRPYIVSALNLGMITGSDTTDGVSFRPNEVISKAEAAVMLQNILRLPANDTASVFSFEEDVVPVWASSSAIALHNAGVDLNIQAADECMTRRDTARVLYQTYQILRQQEATLPIHVQ